MALLEVEGLVKYFGRRLVVDGVSFEVNAGEVVGLLGPNGAGKTTSFRMATGQIAPNGGRVVFNGEDVTGLPMYQRARRGMGYLSQEPSVFRKLTVEKNLLAILEALPRSRSLKRRLTRRERWEWTNAALKRFKLEQVRKNPAGRCSGGEKRRLEIARCLVCEPLLILLDEPFAAVDPKTTEDIRANIRDLAAHGIGVLITDHNVREVFRSADRVYLISEGQVVTHGTPHELVNDQKAIDAYLGRSFEEDGFTRHFAARSHTLPTGATQQPVARVVASSGPPVVAAPLSPVSTTTPLPIVNPADTAFPAGTSPAAGTLSSPVVTLLELEKLRRWVEQLIDDATMKAATVELVARGAAAIPLLLDALERRESALRRRAMEVLKFVAREHLPFDFDPDAPDEVRLRQVSYLRVKLSRRKSA
ncbi:MAG TPA: LPS export ABC transporter ATP-binding protein [Gemmataceae bacterium]|nr:LPS export ABC transporter ATP-binding protein [Gemmataceae bacterium]